MRVWDLGFGDERLGFRVQGFPHRAKKRTHTVDYEGFVRAGFRGVT